MAYSNVTYTGDGSTTTFAVPFPYLTPNHITVLVNSSPAPFTWTTPATIQLASAPPTEATVKIVRTTPISTPQVVFSDGGTLTASDLNAASLQDLYATQESVDAAGTTVITQGVTRFKPADVLTVTSENTLSDLTFPPNGNLFFLIVNGQVMPLGGGAFSISGTTVTWNASQAGLSLTPGWSVIATYTY